MRLEELRDFGVQMKTEHQISPHQEDKARAKERPFLPILLARLRKSGYPNSQITRPSMPTGDEYLKRSLVQISYPSPRRQPPLITPTPPSTVVSTRTMGIVQKNVWHSKIKLKN